MLIFIISDKPEVSITREAEDSVEEDRSTVVLKCHADANPPGRIFWRKYGKAAVGGGAEQVGGSKRTILFHVIKIIFFSG